MLTALYRDLSVDGRMAQREHSRRLWSDTTMKLTDENLDYMDCRPLGRETGVEISDRLRARIKERQAEMGKSAKPPIPPVTE
jgi:hypothetical protein